MTNVHQRNKMEVYVLLLCFLDDLSFALCFLSIVTLATVRPSPIIYPTQEYGNELFAPNYGDSTI